MARFIAELGSNHNGHLLRAIRLIRRARDAGFDGVKTQQFVIKDLFHPSVLAVRPDLARRQALEIPDDWHETLAEAAHEEGLSYGISYTSPDALGASVGVADFAKVGSYELQHTRLLEALARSEAKELVLSTGGASMEEILRAKEILSTGVKPLTVLHCVSSYPCDPLLANLATIDYLQKVLCAPVGWSDHTRSEEVIERAVWRWRASMVEMHFDLDDRQGEETGHSWTAPRAAEVLFRLRSQPLPNDLARESLIDGMHGEKIVRPFENVQRSWRCDPSDGMRPEVHAREIESVSF